MKLIDKIVALFPDHEFIKADGFDDALLGVDSKSMRLIYSQRKALGKLRKGGMPRQDAINYFEFNINCPRKGNRSPIWCEDEFI